eukprot:6175455-Pleurochrysis_carterae.AAC.1
MSCFVYSCWKGHPWLCDVLTTRRAADELHNSTPTEHQTHTHETLFERVNSAETDKAREFRSKWKSGLDNLIIGSGQLHPRYGSKGQFRAG